MHLLRSELERFVRPMTGLVVLVLVGLAILWGGVFRQLAASTLRAAEGGWQERLEHPATCADYGLEPGPDCEAELEQYRVEAAAWLRGVREEAARMRSLQSWAGAGAFAGNTLSSALGLLAIAFLGVMATGGEWGLGTLRYALLQEGRRPRTVIAKVVATALLGVLLAFVVWAAVGLAGVGFDVLWPLPSAPGDFLVGSLESIARAIPVILAFAALGVMAGSLTRSAIAGYVTAVGIVLASWMLAGVGAVEPYTLTRWIGDWMGFERGLGIAVDHLWPDVFMGRDPILGLVGILGFVAVCTLISVASFGASDA